MVVLVAAIEAGSRNRRGAGGPGAGGIAVAGEGVATRCVLHAARRQEIPAQRAAALGTLDIISISHYFRTVQHRCPAKQGEHDHTVVGLGFTLGLCIPFSDIPGTCFKVHHSG